MALANLANIFTVYASSPFIELVLPELTPAVPFSQVKGLLIHIV